MPTNLSPDSSHTEPSQSAEAPSLDSIDKPKPKWPIAELIENHHYYMENGLMVFTEEYHLCRGRCCGNACRHCPFEHANVRRKP